ncbi:MAG: 4Fe-4S double cluster binding domain-containing protein [Anaerocolumna sp.]
MICTDACPGKAISGRVWSLVLDRDDFFDAMACRKKAREIAAKSIDKKITLCGKCIEVCPYTRKYTQSPFLIL